jgi:hypothetical protein
MRNRSRLTLAVSMLAIAGGTQAQSLPTSQPKYLTIVREEVKLGRNAEHVKNEAAWSAAYDRSKSPDFYLAMTSMTGVNETWFITPQESHAAIEASMRRDESNKQLSAEVDRLMKVDADYLTNVRVLQAMARPELSYGKYPDIGKQRFWEITWFRVRPGHEQQFEAGAKAYIAATGRSVPDASFRTYEITAGMPGPVYLVFSSVPAYGDFDRMASESQKNWGAMTPDEMAVMQKFSTEAMVNAENQRFRLNASMSYVPKSVRDSDPAFWSTKKTMTASTAQTASTQP